ncbi:hypothetical protein J6590_089112 [Homalodisca vitripennis]|nr:hypothetical protein J6590_089112 [Homalodisca vitripennis]
MDTRMGTAVLTVVLFLCCISKLGATPAADADAEPLAKSAPEAAAMANPAAEPESKLQLEEIMIPQVRPQEPLTVTPPSPRQKGPNFGVET